MHYARAFFTVTGGLVLIVAVALCTLSCVSKEEGDRKQDAGGAGQAPIGGFEQRPDAGNEQHDAGSVVVKDAGNNVALTGGDGGPIGEGSVAVKDAGNSHSDAGGALADAGSASVSCGSKVCGSGQYCCNASCSVCAPVGEVCGQQVCEPIKKCDASECQPSMGLANILCADGSTAGPVCERNVHGTCRWVITACPPKGCDACADNQYCAVANCGRNGEQGVCTSRPSTPCAALSLISPVCGCDGKTYDHPYCAYEVGVAVDYDGKCVCAEGFADCDSNPLNGCEIDLSSANNCGTCRNVCEQGAACVNGSCSTQSSSCGGIAGFVCPSTDQYCDYAGSCDVADAMGVCKTRPQMCTMQYNPVCGCDHKTYGNACNAASAGMSIRYAGECKTGVCTYGTDQSCNDNPMTSSIHGHCTQERTCICSLGGGYNPLTGRCL